MNRGCSLPIVLLVACGRLNFEPRGDAGTSTLADARPDAFGGPSSFALKLDGQGYVQIDSLCPSLTSAFTIQLWLNPSPSQIDQDSSSPFAINSQTGGANTSLMMWDGPGTRIGYFDDVMSNRFDNIAATTMPGTWHLMSLVIDLDGNGVVYADDLVSMTFTTTRTVSPPCRISIGQEFDANGPSDQIVGLVDAVSVWQVAKSQEQIRADILANPFGDEPSLAAYYTFDGGDVRDDSGRGHTGTLVGTAAIVAVP